MNAIDISKHPCFNEEVKGVCGRIHLPVAPACNIKCNYCDRKHDCVNESRPGVSSAILTPTQAVAYLDAVMARESSITVVGIAGPGDPLANPEETFGTMEAIRAAHPEMLFCLSTNGLKLPENVDRIAKVGVSHVTVTINAVDPAIGEKIYAWVRDGIVIHRGRAAAELMLSRQLEGVAALKERGIVVKVNTILIPGINDHHVEEVAKKMSSMGVDILNVMAMVPNPGTPFGELGEPTAESIHAARDVAGKYLPQMKHCQRCRADAVGLLGCDRSGEFADDLIAASRTIQLDTSNRPYVAVATREGLLVNQHLGEADSFEIYARSDRGFERVETRPSPARGGGDERWRAMAETLKDCRAVLASGFGKAPEGILTELGPTPLEMSGFIEMALKAVFEGSDLGALRVRKPKGCGKGMGCGGDGTGCG